jgi:biotin carboxylase
MKSQSQVCVIVDAYTTGKYLAPSFQEKGFECVHIQSSQLLPFQEVSYIESDFIEVIKHDGNLDKTLKALEKYQIKCLLPGMETGVQLADYLSEKLGLPSNGTELSVARRDKYKMVEALKASGVRSVEHFKSEKLEDILAWVDEIDSYPIVVKPINSAGTDNVRICSSKDEVNQAFQAIKGTKNFLGIENHEVLVQKYLQGTEFIINTVSCGGQHTVTDIWQCRKKLQYRAYVYDLEELIPYVGKEQNLLIDYTFSVLDALSIKYGAAHSEVMLTNDGPILIEVGARLHGSINPDAVTECVGHNHVSKTVESYIDPVAFLKKVNNPYNLHKRSFCLALISEFSGIIKDFPGLKKIEKLPSFFSIKMSVNSGDLLQKTVDLVSSPGIIYLIHEDRDVLEQDYQTIRNIEKQELYNF